MRYSKVQPRSLLRNIITCENFADCGLKIFQKDKVIEIQKIKNFSNAEVGRKIRWIYYLKLESSTDMKKLSGIENVDLKKILRVIFFNGEWDETEVVRNRSRSKCVVDLWRYEESDLTLGMKVFLPPPSTNKWHFWIQYFLWRGLKWNQSNLGWGQNLRETRKQIFFGILKHIWSSFLTSHLLSRNFSQDCILKIFHLMKVLKTDLDVRIEARGTGPPNPNLYICLSNIFF